MKNLLFPFSRVVFVLTLTTALHFAAGHPAAGASVQGECEFGVAAAKRASQAISGFAAKMYRKLVDANPLENTVVSPVSISLALALLEAGASGDTQKALQAQLGAPATNEPDSSSSYQALQRQLSQIRGEKAALRVANGLFHKEGLSLKSSYLSKTSKCFDTEIQAAPFATDLEAARRQVNQWVSNATNEKIPELFKPNVLPDRVMVVLANAIHMKAQWMERFPKLEDLSFYRDGLANQAQTTSFMVREGPYPYFEDDKLERVEIPYHGDLSMHIILPKQRDGLKAIEQQASMMPFFENSNTNATAVRPVNLKIPIFSARSTLDLKSALEQLGLEKIFSEHEADFSRMTSQRTYVSKVVHEAYIKVNENGTEAAAATGIVVAKPTSIEIPVVPPINFIADHPFMYQIWHKPTQALLFVGRVNAVEKVE